MTSVGVHAPGTGSHPSAPVPMESLVEAMTRLRTRGYIEDLTATPEGTLVCRSCGADHEPEQVEVREIVRFEGDSNPDDQAILIALSCGDGCLGQFTSAFGPGTPTADMGVLTRLPRQGRGR